jgi:hypothetical protein
MRGYSPGTHGYSRGIHRVPYGTDFSLQYQRQWFLQNQSVPMSTHSHTVLGTDTTHTPSRPRERWWSRAWSSACPVGTVPRACARTQTPSWRRTARTCARVRFMRACALVRACVACARACAACARSHARARLRAHAPEVADFEARLVIDEHVRRLQVQMHKLVPGVPNVSTQPTLHARA